MSTRRRLSCAVGALAVTTVALGHDDDPKAGTAVKPWPGPGWRAAHGGVAGGDQFDAQAVSLLSWVTLGEFSDFDGQDHTAANDCWGYTSPSGREYAIIGLWRGTAWVEITDPADAQIVAAHPGPTSTWRDMKTFQEYCYAVSEGGDGIQVFDMTDIDSGVVTHVGDITSPSPLNSNKTHNVALNEETGRLFRCGGGGNGLRIYDLNENPAAPIQLSHWTERYVHDAQVVSWTEGDYAGREIAFCFGGFNGGWVETGLDILDVTGAGVEPIARLEYSLPGYSHQGWLSQDRKYVYLNDEADEGGDWGDESRMIIIDISDLENPVEVGSYTNGVTAVTHNLFTRWNLVFAANYSSGLRVFDVNDVASITEVAFFDTNADDSGVNFHNLWGTYPYFPSGTIIGSDRSKGLFVWQLDEDLIPSGPDINGDGVVDVEDLVLLIASWGPCPPDCPADVDGDGEVGVPDLVEVIANWG